MIILAVGDMFTHFLKVRAASFECTLYSFVNGNCVWNKLPKAK